VSLICVVSAPDALAITADSGTATTHAAGDLLWRHRFEVDRSSGPALAVPFAAGDRKLIVLRDRYLLAIAGVTPGPTCGAALDAIARHPAVMAADDDAGMSRAIRQAIAELSQAYPVAVAGASAELGTAVVFAYRNSDGVLCADLLHGNGQSQALNWDASRGARSCGRFLIGQQQLVAGMLDAIELPVQHFTAPLAVDFSRFAVQLAIDAQRFTPGLRLVAAPVSTAVLDSDGARSVSRPL
jgi:hypothetical protein